MNYSILDYDKISTVLKRYSFESKMNIAQIYSRRIMINGDEHSFNTNIPLPWELETFVLFSVHSEEWRHNKIDNKLFINIINSIRDYISPKFEKYKGTEDFVKWFKITAAGTQFYSQQKYIFLFYRYNFYFSFRNHLIDMETLFTNRFGHNYYDYLIMAQSFWIALMTDPKTGIESIIPTLHKHYLNYISKIAINRDDYIKEMNSLSGSFEDYIYSLRPSYSYPFIEYNNYYYLPTPHLLFQAVTSSMLYRLTEDDDKLRELIGKEVFESYLLKIILDSNEFDQALPEQVYKEKNNEKKTVDVMAIKNNTIVLFDSKSYVPKSKLRLISEEAFKSDISRIAKAVVQVYKHARQKIGNEYYYFNKSKEFIDFEKNVFGVVIIQEDGYLPEEKIFIAAINELKLNEAESQWLKTHIFVISLYELETILFTNQSITSYLRNKSVDTNYLIDCCCDTESIVINDFKTELYNEVQERMLIMLKDE